MNNSSLIFVPVLERPDLVSSTVFEAIRLWPGPESPMDFLVAEIDPAFANGTDVCAKYGIDPSAGANCLVVQASRGQTKTLATCLVPVGYRYDMSGVVRRQMNARQVSVAPLELVLQMSQMEFGSITPIGLPNDWLTFIDPLVLVNERIVIGGGLKKSKLSIPSVALTRLPGAQKLEGLARLDIV
jgi:prolyl-tRNA editing enzyme YbaK/EbsC (Cys-tRNA(Pro) deacylase)